MSTDLRLAIPKTILEKMKLNKNSYMIVIEKENSFEVFKAKIEVDTN